MMRISGALIGAALLGGCVSQPAEQMVWVRTDGRMATGNVALENQYKVDAAICMGEASKAAAAAPPVYYSGLGGAIAAGSIVRGQQDAVVNVAVGCMAERGYVRVPAAEAAATAEQFRKGKVKPSA